MKEIIDRAFVKFFLAALGLGVFTVLISIGIGYLVYVMLS
jgi:hypothetical protein